MLIPIPKIIQEDSTIIGGISQLDEKIILLCGMVIATLFFALLPFKLLSWTRQNTKWKIVVSLASCFSGGVFIAACILDLFPDVHEAMNRVLDEIQKETGQTIDYPAAGFVICVGFFIVLIIEQVILSCKESWAHPFETDMNGETTSLLHEDLHRDHSHQDHQISNSNGYGSTNSNSGVISGLSSIDDENSGTINILDQTHNHDHMGDVFQHSTLRSTLLLIALSFHSMFEGLAIGLQQDQQGLVNLFIAVIAHKSVMAFSLGLTLAQARLKFKQYAISVIIFTMASPIGMLIGMGMSEMEQSLGGDIANCVLQGIAGGTFLYITFFEVLPHELNQRGNRMMKLLFVLLGFICICCLLFITH